MSQSLKMTCAFHVERQARGRKKVAPGEASVPDCEPGRVPHVSKLLALAHRFEALVRSGRVKDYAELARLGHVTRARMSQVMALLNLASDIQEQILELPRTIRGRDPLQMHHLLPITQVFDWRTQRRLWAAQLLRLERITETESQ